MKTFLALALALLSTTLAGSALAASVPAAPEPTPEALVAFVDEAGNLVEIRACSVVLGLAVYCLGLDGTGASAVGTGAIVRVYGLNAGADTFVIGIWNGAFAGTSGVYLCGLLGGGGCRRVF